MVRFFVSAFSCAQDGKTAADLAKSAEMKAILSSKLIKSIMRLFCVIVRRVSHQSEVRSPIISFTSTTVVTAEQLVAAIRSKDANVITMVKKMSKQEMDRKDKVRNYCALVH